MYLVIIPTLFGVISGAAIDLLDVSSLEPVSPNYCNDRLALESILKREQNYFTYCSVVMGEAGLIRATLGQFLGYECSAEFYHCRWQSDGFRTYRKHCKTGEPLAAKNRIPTCTNRTLEIFCLVYDVLGTQNCNYDYNVKSCGIRGGALCTADEFACIVSEQCIDANRRCNGIAECSDGTDEMDCDGESWIAHQRAPAQ
ncbi:Low-density lipoprotein receptor domain class A [Ancylostoma ceylanicum]|uniref:Low-density lipoprotein receptor domain class A n=1 Tax=Ancylostoma ceylanicum TaxID=53326 RepID=A0A0D6LZ55_9BILA|nr:Low-density lipoprotein receptor domain class A [Ancylostoma ceylanicum]